MSTAADDGAEPYLPVVPEEAGADPLLLALLHVVAFLDLADESAVEPDAALDALEHVGLYVARLPDGRREALGRELQRLAAYGREHGWPDDSVEVVEKFLEHCGLPAAP